MVASTILRWVARSGGIAVFLLFGAFFFGGEESMRPNFVEAIGLLFFPVGVLAGFALAWRREAAGGLLSLASLGMFFLWLLARDGRVRVNGAGWFLLLAAPAFFFIASAALRAWGRRSAGATAVTAP